MSGLFIGLLSGTSIDAIDAALVRFDPAPELVHAHNHPFPAGLRERLAALIDAPESVSLHELGELDARLGLAFADAVEALLQAAQVERGQVRAIGSHGQTVFHAPDARPPFTLQIGDPNRIAELTGIDVVADLRRRDMAAGGQGAPLAPAIHVQTLASADESRAVLNLGGIANLTLLPAGGGQILGFDTGPANCLMDAWIARHRQRSYDRNGDWASEGRVDAELLARLLDEPFFALAPPKSTGRELFHLAWLEQRLAGTESAQDVQATLAELTARSTAQALQRYLPDVGRLLICGGGVHNGYLWARLAAQLPGVELESTSAYGLDPDWVEAVLMAWMAERFVAGEASNLPSVTGAEGPRVLGALFPA